MSKRKREKPHIQVAKDKPNPYLKYRPAHPDTDVPPMPLVAYESSVFGYTIYKYLAPAALVFIYMMEFKFNLSLRDTEYFSWLKAFISPVQLVTISLLIVNVALTRSLAHIIVAEDGLFVRHFGGREFIPWKYLRSYHMSKHMRPFLIRISYHGAGGHIRRYHVIASLETQHTTVEMLNFMRRVHREATGHVEYSESPEFEHAFV